MTNRRIEKTLPASEDDRARTEVVDAMEESVDLDGLIPELPVSYRTVRVV